MQYEPIGYIFEYEIGALAFYLVIMLRYFSARRFPNQKNRLYALIMCTIFADVILDVLSSYIIDNVFLVPVAVTYILNTLFYALNVTLLVLMMLFAYALTGYINRARLRRISVLLLPGIVIMLMLILNPLTRWFFYIDPVQGYIHAPYFKLFYVTCLLYLAFTLAIVLKNRRILRKEEFLTVIIFLAVVLLSTLVQYFVPALLIMCVATMLAVVLMFFTIQNPETMVDMTTGAFTYEAMLTFLRDRMHGYEQVQLVAVKVRNMSRINDLLGIENGSLVLRSLVEFLAQDANDTWIFRMRGSCFVAVTRRKEDYAAIKTRISQHIGQPWRINGTEVLLKAIVCSIETEGLLADPISPEQAVDYLETAFNENENVAGRIVNVSVGAELLDRVKRNNLIEQTLRAALDTGEGLELYFQPLWSVQKERFVSAEVLLRYRHPLLGIIAPDEFVSIAENNGFITTLDEFVVRQTCKFVHDHEEIYSLGIDTVEVNLSALEFMQRRLPELLGDIMKEYQIEPNLLCFEVTETAATESFALLLECMKDIIKLGCKFALDDFGVGYANISQVIQLPFSIVKLDKSMLGGPPAVLEDLLRMFARIDRRTVIEGVETLEQAKLVKSFGVDVIQGFYYAKPMNGDEFINFLRNDRGLAQLRDDNAEN